MSWVARKIAGLDNEDQKQVEVEYFKRKQEERLLTEQHQSEEIKKFWAEYGDQYFNG